jgi:hypothetical protein
MRKTHLILALLAVLSSGCAGPKVLKKKVGDAPENVWRCKREVQDPYYLCEKDPDTFQVVDPQ